MGVETQHQITDPSLFCLCAAKFWKKWSIVNCIILWWQPVVTEGPIQVQGRSLHYYSYQYLVNKVFTNMDKGFLTWVIFLDLKKAFDTGDHDIMLKKLAMYGVSPTCILWFKSYLCGRSQVTMIQGVKSSPKGIACGISQGSILGPLLFIIYTNDMSEYMD